MRLRLARRWYCKSDAGLLMGSDAMHSRACWHVERLSWIELRSLMVSCSTSRRTTLREGKRLGASEKPAHRFNQTPRNVLYQSASEEQYGHCKVLIVNRWVTRYHKGKLTEAYTREKQGGQDFGPTILHQSRRAYMDSTDGQSQNIRVEAYTTYHLERMKDPRHVAEDTAVIVFRLRARARPYALLLWHPINCNKVSIGNDD